MVDQGIISGPALTDNTLPVSNYTPGYLAPWKFAHWLNTGAETKGLKLPFASAKYGKRPPGNDPNQWAFEQATAPLGAKRDSLEYATALFRKTGAAGQDVGRPGYTVPRVTPSQG